MDGLSGSHRRSIDRRTATKGGLAVATLLIFTAIVGPTLLNPVPPVPSPSGGIAQASPTAPAATAPLPSPEGSAQPWDDLALPPFEPLADLAAADTDRLGVAPGTSFSLRSLTATPAVELATGLRIEPQLDFRVEEGPSPDVAIIRPAAPLAAGVRYRMRLAAPDGSLAGSWAFLARSPLRIVGTLPGNQAIEVPPNTGIEVTFDQDGSTGVAERFEIQPAATGRFEAHGRTWAFIPDQPLAPGTIYTVTVRGGVAVTGSSETLESDVTFRFETALASGTAPRLTFGRSMIEIRPGTEPVIALDLVEDEESGPTPGSAIVHIHRLPTFAAVVAAGVALAGPDGWAIASPTARVDTTALPKVGSVDAIVTGSNFGTVLQVPTRLEEGAYVLTIDQSGAPAQVLVQATNLSAYAMTASRDSLVWVNDIARGGAIPDASVALAGGRTLGRTDATGLLRMATPTELRAPAGSEGFDEDEMVRPATLLTVSAPDGRRLLVPVGLPVSWVYADMRWYGNADDDAWWSVFRSDREAYHQTDTIHLSGLVRARSDRSVPDRVEIRLRPWEASPESVLVRRTVEPSARGAFVADIAFEGLPRATYAADLYADGRRIATVWIRVTEVRKPAYRIEVETDRRASLAGQPVRITATATFFDGTAVPGLALRVAGFGDEAIVTTDSQGVGSVELRAGITEETEGWSAESIDVAPANPEEGQIGADDRVLVFPSKVWTDADGAVRDGRIVVDGHVGLVDFAAVEAAIAAGADVKPRGAAVANGAVQAVVVHLVPVRTQRGTYYDFIEKKVVPQYDYDVREERLTTVSLRTSADGTFRLSIPAPVEDDSYQVTFTARDADGRAFRRAVYVSEERVSDESGVSRPYLELPGYCGSTPLASVGLGDPVNLTMRLGDGQAVPDGRLLFVIGQRGALETLVQDAATLRRVLRDADLPGFTVRAVWLSRDGYAVGDVTAQVRLEDKTLEVDLQPDRDRYAPGDRVTIAIRTRDAAGRGVAADVVLQGVDEKLHELGLVPSLDPVGELMRPTSPGFGTAYRSHGLPSEAGDGCGDTGGGRDEFVDTVTFQHVTTDDSGRGSATFQLSDDLTSWRMQAMAVSGRLDSGAGSVLVPVGLPFFVDAILAQELLVGETPVLRMRGYGDALGAGDDVRFTVSAPSLGLAPTTLSGEAFRALRVALPAVTVGSHDIRIEAEASGAGQALRDVLIRRINVLPTRLSTLEQAYGPLTAAFVPQGGDGLTRYVITDAGRGALLPRLERLATARSGRFDRTAAADLARDLLIGEFGVPADSLTPIGFDASRYQQDGIALLPYASTDLFLSARAALVVPTKVDADELASSMQEWLGGRDGEPATREQAIVALAGLAGLGVDVLADLRAVEISELTVMERLWLGLGLQAAGDDAAAREIERGLLESHGERLGPWVRLGGAGERQSLEASALLLLLAARLGDPLAPDVARYLDDNPSGDLVFPLEELGYAQASLERLPRTAARFAWALEGERHEVALEPGGAYTLVLAGSQWRQLRIEPIDGKLAVSTAWTIAGAGLPDSPSIHVRRTVSPADNAPDDRLVRVRLEVTFGTAAPGGCYRLTDLVPSGLAPIGRSAGWSDDSESSGNSPYEIEGQRVTWCAAPDDPDHTYSYAARVVSPGTYRWEAAVLQWEAGPEIGASTPSLPYTIR